MARIGVDLTPLLPRGENGGASVLTLELLQVLPALAPQWEWVLFTSPAGTADVLSLDAPNVRHETVDLSPQVPGIPGTRRRVFRGAKRFMPDRLHVALRVQLRNQARRRAAPFLASRQAGLDLVFSPFGSTSFIGSDIPFVAVVHDLLHVAHPEFLDPLIVDQRMIELEEIVRDARRVICVSEFARRSLLETTGVPPGRISVIPNMILQRPVPVRSAVAEEVLAAYGLEPSRFYLYPANCWPHKNHLRLLEAYALFRQGRSGPHPRLLLVGAGTGGAEDLGSAVARLGLEGEVVRPGYVPDAHLALFFSRALAVVYPSLYEGFGLATLEAMAVGTPVACSRTASLPEVAGDAALYFDPLSAPDIARALGELLEMDPPARAALVEKGLRRFREHGSPEALASSYLALLAECLPGVERSAARLPRPAAGLSSSPPGAASAVSPSHD